MTRNLEKAAQCGEPSYVWREGQMRRLRMVLEAAGARIKGRVLENGCGIGIYAEKLRPHAREVFGLEYDFERSLQAHETILHVLNAAGEYLPFCDNAFDLILSHEVLEHVHDDRKAVVEMVRCLKPGGRMIVFTPNRGYPFETHGIYWRKEYHFGNIPLVNWLPRYWRDKLAPHVNVYSRRDMHLLFSELPIHTIKQTVIYGAYDNLITRYGRIGTFLRDAFHFLESTPLRVFGLSHLWVMEKNDEV
jgi:SAM-dependent methyltransferase